MRDRTSDMLWYAVCDKRAKAIGVVARLDCYWRLVRAFDYQNVVVDCKAHYRCTLLCFERARTSGAHIWRRLVEQFVHFSLRPFARDRAAGATLALHFGV